MEGPPTKEHLGFYALAVYPRTSLPVHPPRWCYWTPISLVIQEAGNSQFLPCLPVSVHLAGVTHICALCYLNNSRPFVPGSNPELNLHFNLCLESSYLDQMDSSTQVICLEALRMLLVPFLVGQGQVFSALGTSPGQAPVLQL